ncbi:MAG: phosphatidate cytidylyltransferase [Clostridiales bacterium]|nr:phosphatidate cytidylyltransferase [Clostridiales bacterium]MCI6614001.1 phosphatidate cytidylyltransferase [Clostridiales bacterium]
MKQRILVAVIGIPLLLLVLCWAPHWATAALLAALGVIGAHELLAAVSGAEKTKSLWVLAGFMAVCTVFSTYAGMEAYKGTVLVAVPWLLCASVVLLFLLAVRWFGRENAVAFQDVCAVLLGGVAIPLAMSCLLRLRLMEFGGGLVLMPLVAAFMSDSAALFTGMACGKHKLAPKASPKKTVEGAVGGLVGGIVGMVLFRIVFFFVTVQALSIGWCMVIGLVGAFMGQLGDLSFSVIKRQCGIKDYGRLLPGHGGVLDRFDSVIFAAPVVWMIACAVGM